MGKGGERKGGNDERDEINQSIIIWSTGNESDSVEVRGSKR